MIDKAREESIAITKVLPLCVAPRSSIPHVDVYVSGSGAGGRRPKADKVRG